jgi:ABC-type antimicrobial peptide transport system permease subunit
MQKQIAAINPDQEVRGKITNLEARIQDEPAWARGRLNAALFGGFSLLALILSAIGLYSVVSYTVAQRANEFGIRLALGAARSHVWRIVLGSLVASVGGGVLVGLVLTLALNRMAQSWSAGYRSKPEMLLPAIVILALVSGLACALPAWRASTIDPMVALRSE